MKPSKINVVRAKKAWFLSSSFAAITLFGTVFCNSKKDVYLINASDEVDSDLKSHETIHVRQARSIHNSWILFYIRYMWEWICNIPLLSVNKFAPYKFMPLEIEAYLHEDDWSYCKQESVTQWKAFEKLTLKEKKGLAEAYYKNPIKFREFIKSAFKYDTFIEQLRTR